MLQKNKTSMAVKESSLTSRTLLELEVLGRLRSILQS